MRCVAREILDPARGAPREHGDELRYGRRGSMSVDTAQGTWFDHEAGVGGGVIDLVRHVRGCGRPDALAWLRECRYIDSEAGGGFRRVPRTVRSPAPRERVSSTPVAGARDAARAALVRSIWSASEIDTSRTPVRLYLRSRRVWIPFGYGCVRWLPRERAPTPVPDLRWFGLPRAAAGAALYGYERDGSVVAVSFEALSAGGARLRPRWRQMRGVRAGACFVVRRAGGQVLHVAEGEVDALALARRETGSVYGLGGTSGLCRVLDVVGGHRRIVVHADAGGGGGRAAVRAVKAVRAAGLRASIVWCREDPAGDWEVNRR